MLQDKSRLGHARMLETVLAAMKVWLNDITRHKIQSRHLSDGLVDWGSLKRMAKSRLQNELWHRQWLRSMVQGIP
jgi:hypothetical protein